jgi:hypothetical protein
VLSNAIIKTSLDPEKETLRHLTIPVHRTEYNLPLQYHFIIGAFEDRGSHIGQLTGCETRQEEGIPSHSQRSKHVLQNQVLSKANGPTMAQFGLGFTSEG